MIDKYSQFLAQKLLLESEIKYSDGFRKILSSIGDPVSKTLSSLENQDIKTNVNFIDILKDDKEQLSFIQDKKASTLLSKLKNEIDVTWNGQGGILRNNADNEDVFSALGYVRPESGNLPRPASTQTRGKLLRDTISPKSGKIYVLVKFGDMETVLNKEFLNFVDRSSEIWTQSGRQPMRVGRAVTALLQNAPVKHTAVEIADFVNRYKTKIDELNDVFRFIEVVSGDDIAKWYHVRNYEDKSGGSELHRSCMARKSDSVFEIYTKNPEVCQLIIQKSESDPDKISARALLWTLNSGKKFMDRVYFNDPQSIELFRSYCKENNIWAKYNNNSGAFSSAINPENGSREEIEIEVALERRNYVQFPYMDTLKFFHPKKAILDNSHEDDPDWYKLEDTGGDYISQKNQECDRCYGEDYVDCWECDGSSSFPCDNCDGNGEVEDEDGSKVSCGECNGRGSVNCDTCDGDGRVLCPECG
ncbi:MAG: hypothetical protein EBS55_07825 [Flavobacteriaceae bacterium]|nr:hypothetical protein [Flavobacteriaceae bacterium]